MTIRKGEPLKKSRDRKRPAPREADSFEMARNELFSAIHQCGVMHAPDSERDEWMADTVSFLAERHPELTATQVKELRDVGMRFCQPVIPHGREHSAVSTEDANAA